MAELALPALMEGRRRAPGSQEPAAHKATAVRREGVAAERLAAGAGQLQVQELAAPEHIVEEAGLPAEPEGSG